MLSPEGKPARPYSIVAEATSFLLVLLLAYAGSSKLTDERSFQSVIARMPYLRNAQQLISWFVPSMEVIVAVLLCVQRLRLTAFWLSLILLSGFTLYLLGMRLSGQHLPCSCGGVIQYLSWTQHIFFNLFFILLATMGIIFQTKTKRIIQRKKAKPLQAT